MDEQIELLKYQYTYLARKITVKCYGGMWDLSKKKGEIETKISKSALSKIFKIW